jgi:hypothetical protein
MKRFLLAAALVVLGLPAAHADLPEFASWLAAGSCPALPAVGSPEPELKNDLLHLPELRGRQCRELYRELLHEHGQGSPVQWCSP